MIFHQSVHTRLPLMFLFGSALLFVVSVICQAPLLPERVAVHFNLAGQPNGWMTRGQHLWMILLLGFGLPALVIGLCYCTRWFPPSMLNAPNAAYWRSPDRYPKARQILMRWAYGFGAISLQWVAALNHQVVEANRVDPPFLDPVPILVLTGLFLAATGVSITLLLIRFMKVKPA